MMTTIKTRLFTLAEVWSAHRKRQQTMKALAHLDRHLLKDIGYGHGESNSFSRR